MVITRTFWRKSLKNGKFSILQMFTWNIIYFQFTSKLLKPSTILRLIFVDLYYCYVKMPNYLGLQIFIVRLLAKYYPYPHKNYIKSDKYSSFFSIEWSYWVNFSLILSFSSVYIINSSYKHNLHWVLVNYCQKTWKIGNFSFSDFP